jgi:hypothetical protein
MDRSRCLERSGILHEIVALKPIDTIVRLALNPGRFLLRQRHCIHSDRTNSSIAKSAGR